MHFVMKCTQYKKLRAKVLQSVENKYIALKSLNDENKTIYKRGQKSLSWHIKISF